jgi:hypothetical protein
MPIIIVKTNNTGEEAGLVTLAEQVTAANLEDRFYASQLIEWLNWATADAETVESPPANRDYDQNPPGASRVTGARGREIGAE